MLVTVLKAGECLVINGTMIEVDCRVRLRISGERADITFPNQLKNVSKKLDAEDGIRYCKGEGKDRKS